MSEAAAPKRKSSGNNGVAKAAKERRRQEAEERNAAYQKRPIAERMKTAGAREKARLMKQQQVEGTK